MIELKINQIIVTDDITQLPLSVQKKVLEEMTIARDKLTNEMSRVRLNIRDLEYRPTLEELVIEHIRKESRPDDPDVPIDIFDGHLVRIPLPQEPNAKWTFRNWEWAKSFCEAHPGAVPCHDDDLDHSSYTFIDCSGLRVRPME